jgi:predicted nuclease with RNAse H fold
MRVAGLDLAGSERRDTGYCLLKGGKASALILHGDGEILRSLENDKPEIIAIDAPLSLPKGRKSIGVRDRHHFRECDLELRRLGIRFFPITLGPMRMLTKRGMSLKRKIARLLPKARVIEAYPGAAYDLLGAKRKNKKSIRSLFRRFALRIPTRALSQDELDGICCALVGRMFAKGDAAAIGDAGEGSIIIPRADRRRSGRK